MIFLKKKDRTSSNSYISLSFLLLKDGLYIYIVQRLEVFFYKRKKIEHRSRTQSADVDTQVSLSPHHPSCKRQGSSSTKHKDSLVRNKHSQPATGTERTTAGKGRLAG